MFCSARNYANMDYVMVICLISRQCSVDLSRGINLVIPLDMTDFIV